jgi:putative acetyltransferase
VIRYARAADHPAIAEVNRAAFGRAEESELIERLRADEDVLFELVAETDGEVTGHIVFSRLWADSQHLFAALAPMAVRPGLQRGGVGSALVRTGLEYAREFGVHGVLVLGHVAYYPRFGFSADEAKQISSAYSGSPSFMALALEPGAFDAPLSVVYPDAFSG